MGIENCQKWLMRSGGAYPRTCAECGLAGPCRYDAKPTRPTTAKPDHLLAHEALDRTHLVRELLAKQLGGHAFILKNANLSRLVDEASRALDSLYQAIVAKQPE